ncbi:hypothetical protein GCM10010468_50750 [Actinocorallia longicatena]|uniref:Histidine phosphatase superfamily protein (Branch 1) n=1 Tax=Actinocorallia longicatena TaxID=111803 RepID=A0ABP6QH66_9ACTN
MPYQEWQVEEFTYLGELRGMTTPEERRPLAMAFWERADPDFRYPGGESFGDLFARAHACVEGLAVTDGFVAMFTHGLFMRAVAWVMLTGVTGPTHDEILLFRRFVQTYTTPNACIVELGFGARRSVRAGTTTHLPAGLVSDGF